MSSQLPDDDVGQDATATSSEPSGDGTKADDYLSQARAYLDNVYGRIERNLAQQRNDVAQGLTATPSQPSDTDVAQDPSGTPSQPPDNDVALNPSGVPYQNGTNVDDPSSRGKAYLEYLHGKIKRKEPLTPREKRFLLYTGRLPYKALAAPESLTLEERNRIRLMPPPGEVEANIRRVFGDSYNGSAPPSTPEDVFRLAVDSAETMTDDQLDLIIHGFHINSSRQEKVARFRWITKLGPAGELAFTAVTTELEETAHRRAAAIKDDPVRRRPKRERRIAALLEQVATPEGRSAYYAGDTAASEEAARKAQLWDEQDEALFARSREAMLSMAKELEWAEGHCEECARGRGQGQEEQELDHQRATKG